MIIGITGGTGCGKTTLLNEIAQKGGLILDCDVIYHELLHTDRALLSKIDTRFPGTVENGVLNRKKLGELVFSDEQALQDLNIITHGAVKVEILRRLEQAPQLAAIDAIALFEGGLAELCDVTVAIMAPLEDRVLRLMKRDGISREYAQKRILAQKGEDFYMEHCDATLCNDGDLASFQQKCRDYLENILNRSIVMEKKEKNLVVLAAGIGSRFKGGVKQLQSVGPSGECIMDYSVHDAIEAGFNRIVFIIRHDIEQLFNEAVGNRIRSICREKGVEMVCAYQDKQNLPEGFLCPENRSKPWGTGQALLSCKGILHGGSVVINADDFYGKEAYQLMSDFLDGLAVDSQGVYGLAGFRLSNTLSENGGVTRGVCQTDDNDMLTQITETRNIVKDGEGAAVEVHQQMVHLDGNVPVSMNMWAFTPDLLERLEEQFADFLRDGGLETLDSEFLIPVQIGEMIEKKAAQVKVIYTSGRWFGMTYAEDTPTVRKALEAMAKDGIYPDLLF